MGIIRLLGLFVCLQITTASICQQFGGQCYAKEDFCSSILSGSSGCGYNQQCCLSKPHPGKNTCERMHQGTCIPDSLSGSCNLFGVGMNGENICGTYQTCCIEFDSDGAQPTEPTDPAGHDDCGKPEVPVSEGWRIVNGQTSEHGNWPWQVSLRFYGQHICGGSIINNQWILTAAHCFGQISHPSQLKIVSGDWKQRIQHGTEEMHQVERIILHEQYTGRSPNSPNDIALVKLARPLTYNKYRKRVCLNDTPGKFEWSKECWLTGWGQTKGTAESTHLQQVKGQVISLDHCRRLWYGGIQDSHICFGEGRNGACMGDSGGPFVCRTGGRFYQVGVSSFGTPNCYGKPSVYTRVSSHINWIRQRTGGGF